MCLIFIFLLTVATSALQLLNKSQLKSQLFTTADKELVRGVTFAGGINNARNHIDMYTTVKTDTKGLGQLRIVASLPKDYDPKTAQWNIERIILTFPTTFETYVLDRDSSQFLQTGSFIPPLSTMAARPPHPWIRFVGQIWRRYTDKPEPTLPPQQQYTQKKKITPEQQAEIQAQQTEEGKSKARTFQYYVMGAILLGATWYLSSRYSIYRRDAFYRYIRDSIQNNPELRSAFGSSYTVKPGYSGRISNKSGSALIELTIENGSTKGVVKAQGATQGSTWKAQQVTFHKAGAEKSVKINI